MTPKVNQENTEAMYHFGLKILFDGYLINPNDAQTNALINRHLLFDDYLIKMLK